MKTQHSKAGEYRPRLLCECGLRATWFCENCTILIEPCLQSSAELTLKFKVRNILYFRILFRGVSPSLYPSFSYHVSFHPIAGIARENEPRHEKMDTNTSASFCVAGGQSVANKWFTCNINGASQQKKVSFFQLLSCDCVLRNNGYRVLWLFLTNWQSFPSVLRYISFTQRDSGTAWFAATIEHFYLPKSYLFYIWGNKECWEEELISEDFKRIRPPHDIVKSSKVLRKTNEIHTISMSSYLHWRARIPPATKDNVRPFVFAKTEATRRLPEGTSLTIARMEKARAACNLSVTSSKKWDKAGQTEKLVLWCMCKRQWGLCALRHGIQISMEAILACHPARSTEWLDCHPKSCELWHIHTGLIN